jgi:hypothetical protein
MLGRDGLLPGKENQVSPPIRNPAANNKDSSKHREWVRFVRSRKSARLRKRVRFPGLAGASERLPFPEKMKNLTPAFSNLEDLRAPAPFSRALLFTRKARTPRRLSSCPRALTTLRSARRSRGRPLAQIRNATRNGFDLCK